MYQFCSILCYIFNKLVFVELLFSQKGDFINNYLLRNTVSIFPGNVTFLGKKFKAEKDYFIGESTEIIPWKNNILSF